MSGETILVADDDRVGTRCDHIGQGRHTEDLEFLSDESYPQVFEHIKVYLTEYPHKGGLKPDAKNDFVDALNNGALVSNFVGHGDPLRLAQEEVFNPAAVDLVHTGRRQSLFIAASCNVSKFDDPWSSSMAEQLLARPEGGTIASLASTHLASAGPNLILNMNFIETLFPDQSKYPTVPVADTAAIAKALTFATNWSSWKNSEMFSLFGDPEMELASPQLDVVFQDSAPDTLKRRSPYQFSVTLQDGQSPLESFQGSAEICARESDDATGYTRVV